MITIEHVHKEYPMGGRPFPALQGIDLRIDSGELVFVVGPSGSGKSTLLNLIAGLDRPTRGEVHVAGSAVHALDEDGLSRFRAANVGVVFQSFQLLPTLTAVENVMLAMDFGRKVPAGERRDRALALLGRMGVEDQAGKLPAALSGGQQQRVAIARALSNDPPILVADEPTGNLDSSTARQVMALFTELREAGKTVLVVTHNPDLGEAPTRVVRLADGRLAG